jgi:Family of unknown function (DUF6444)
VPDPRELSREELLAALAERDAVIAALLAEIEQLKRRVGMDSSNSSMPPGSDGVAARVQVSDTPPVRLVTEYQMIQVACPACRTVTRAAAPAGLAGPCCYGPDVRAATALLACNGHMSIERAADLMGVLPARRSRPGSPAACSRGSPPIWRNSTAGSSSGCGPLRCCITMRPRPGWPAMTATG